jgi:hypothetical protein
MGPIVGEDARDHGWDELHDACAAQFGVAVGGWPEGAAEGR